MLFIREYDTKSLDRSSVSMIDKYNARLNKVDELLDRLSYLVDNLLSLIRDIRNTLGQSKQRIYGNLDQVKEVVSGNDITGTENTIKAIEDALKAGDKAIEEAEATLEGVGKAISCSEEYASETDGTLQCGEACNETPTEDDCSYCSYSYTITGPGDPYENSCNVCQEDGCMVNVDCDEETYLSSSAFGWVTDDCTFSMTVDVTCNEYTSYMESCDQVIGAGSSQPGPDNCNFICSHSTGCQQMPMPENCTYTCTDGSGCNFEGDDCSYSTICGQGSSCNEIDCSQYDCGEPCGETCHMTTDNSGDCSEDSCSEDCGDYSDDDYYGGDDCGEACGEDCGDSCGLF